MVYVVVSATVGSQNNQNIFEIPISIIGNYTYTTNQGYYNGADSYALIQIQYSRKSVGCSVYRVSGKAFDNNITIYYY